MKRSVTAAIALAVVLCAGCGTVANFSRPEDGGRRPLEVYGGVTRTAACLVQKIDGDVIFMPSPFVPLLVPDVALSAIADTVTLPVTLSASVARTISGLYPWLLYGSQGPPRDPQAHGKFGPIDPSGQTTPERAIGHHIE
jgi:uncharacterized protein YceK